ncbi:MAG: AraC family transcriptional regulator [Pseudomonadota bacterium]
MATLAQPKAQTKAQSELEHESVNSLSAALLKQFEVLTTRDSEAARGFIAHAFAPHSQTVLDGDVDVQMYYTELPSVGVALLKYGAKVRIETRLNTWFGAVYPIEGYVEAISPHERCRVEQDAAIVLSPSDQLTLTFGHNTKLLIVKMDRVALERAAIRAFSRPLQGPLVFDMRMERSSGKSRTFWRLSELLVRELGSPDAGIRDAAIAAQMELLMLQTLLAAQPTRANAAAIEKPRLAPGYVKMAESYMTAHADEAVDLPALCKAAGVSRRTLYDGFQKYRGISPMLYFKNIRLERVRQDLLRAQDGTSVTEAAMRWGFTQLGRFSGEYKKRFGESPSDTLRFARTHRTSGGPKTP